MILGQNINKLWTWKHDIVHTLLPPPQKKQQQQLMKWNELLNEIWICS